MSSLAHLSTLSFTIYTTNFHAFLISFRLFKMHAVGIHSALAIKRQRKRRDEQKRARERRYSIQSSESGDTHSPHGSTRRKHRHHYGQHGINDSKVSISCIHTNTHTKCLFTFHNQQVVTSIGMLHIGVVFVVFGVFLLGAGLIPDDVSRFIKLILHALLTLIQYSFSDKFNITFLSV